MDEEKNQFRFKVCDEWLQICLLCHSKFISHANCDFLRLIALREFQEEIRSTVHLFF